MGPTIQPVFIQLKLQLEAVYNFVPLRSGLETKSQSKTGYVLSNVPVCHHKLGYDHPVERVQTIVVIKLLP